MAQPSGIGEHARIKAEGIGRAQHGVVKVEVEDAAPSGENRVCWRFHGLEGVGAHHDKVLERLQKAFG